MTSAKKSLQVCVRCLLKSGADRGGPLARHRATSSLRRWTARMQQSATGGLEDRPFDGRGVERNTLHSPDDVSTREALRPLESSESLTEGSLGNVPYGSHVYGSGMKHRGRDNSREHAGGATWLDPTSTTQFGGAAWQQARSFGSRCHSSCATWQESTRLRTRGGVQAHNTQPKDPWQGISRANSPELEERRTATRGFGSAVLHGSQSFPREAFRLCLQRGLSSTGAVEEQQQQQVTKESREEGEEEKEKEKIEVTFINRDGSETVCHVAVGTNFLEAAHDNDVDLEGACEGSCACSTCHVIFEDEDYYNKVPEPSEEENDMLDLAFGLTTTSRLGCQFTASKDLDGVRLRIPSATRNFAVDGYIPKPH